MNDKHNDNLDDLDTRPREARDYREVSKELDARIAYVEKRAPSPMPEHVKNLIDRARYADAVLLHGNCSGRSNPTITLPIPWNVSDIYAVIGEPDDTEPGSDASWRAVRRHYDAGGRNRPR